MSWQKRLTAARTARGLKKSAFAQLVGVSPSTVTQWESGETKKIEGGNLTAVCKELDISAEWLLNGVGGPFVPPPRMSDYSQGELERIAYLQIRDPTTAIDLYPEVPALLPGGFWRNDLPTPEAANPDQHPHRRVADFELVAVGDTDGEVGEIEYWDAKGSCGGGFLNYEQLPKGHLIKEATFFAKYSLKPSNAFAIYADGDSMSDFIVDGDIVIFDRSKTHPSSGKIFAIDHPDGLRIKVLRRGIDGSWTLESKNPDKRSFPDERIEPSQMELLKVLGQFVYRQGG